MKFSLTRNRANHRILTASAASLLALIGANHGAYGQAIAITGPTTYTQNFNTLGTATVAWADGTTVPGWFAGINSNTTADGNLQATDGGAAGAASALSGLVNLGVTGDADRAIGSKATGTGGFANIAYGVLFQNTSAATLQLSLIEYNGEIWHTNSTAANRETWTTFFKTSSTLFTDTLPGGSAAVAVAGAGFTALPAANWTAPNLNVANGSVNGNLAANQGPLISVANPLGATGGIRIAAGEFFMFKWVDTNLGGTDGYQAIDNVRVSFSNLSALVWNLGHGIGGTPDGVWDTSANLYWLDATTPAAYQPGLDVAFSQNGTASIDVPANIGGTGTVTVSNATGTYTIGGAGQIGGALVKSGAGTLSLTSTNAFNAVALNGGTIQLAGVNALGTGPITLGASGGTLENAANYTLANVVTGTGTLTKAGGGTLTMSAVNTHTSTALSAGSTILAGSLPNTHTLNVSGGASLRVGGTIGTGSTITNAGRISGTGTINGTTTVSNGGAIEAGAGGAGTLAFQNLTFGAAAGNAAVFDASLSGGVNVTGALFLNGGAQSVTVNVTGNPAGFVLPHTFTLLDYATIGGAGFGGFLQGTLPNRVIGTLVDNTVDTRLDFTVTSIDFPIWSGSFGSAWVLGSQGGSENWLKNSDLTSTTFLVNDNVVFNDQPSTDQTVTIDGADVTVASLTFANATRNYTFSGTHGIAGNAALVKSGAATVTIGNVNSFAGAVSVNGGTISVAALADSGTNSPLGSGAAVSLDGGGTLEITAAGPVATNRALTINNALGPGGTLRTNGTVTISGAISGSGTLVKTGTGRVIVRGAASGTSTVSAGVLEFGAGANFTGNVTNDATIEITTGATIAGTITNNGILSINRTDIVTMTPVIGGTGGLDMVSGALASVTLGGGAVPNTFAGLTRVMSGILIAGKTAGTNAIGGDLLIDGGSFRYAAAGTQNEIPDTANITVNSGSFGDVANAGPLAQQTDVVNNVTVNGGTFGSLRSGTAAPFLINGTLNVGAAGTVLFQRGGAASANTIVAASGGIFNFDGGSTTPGSLTVNTQESRLVVGAGGLTVTDGRFNFNAGPSGRTAPTAGATFLTTGSRGSTIVLNGLFTSVGNTSILRDPTGLAVPQDRSAIQLDSADRTIDVTGTLNFGTAAAPLSVRDGRIKLADTDPIPAAGGIIKTGPGTLNIPGNQPYTGTTTINAGTFAIDGTLSTSSVTINNGGTLSGKGGTIGGATVNSGGAIVAGVAGSGALSFPTLTLGAAGGDTSSLTVSRSATSGIINVINADGLVVNSGADSVTINLAGVNPGLGQHVLIDYAGNLGGTGFTAFKKGTVPNRVGAAVLENDTVNSTIVLNITSSELPVWTGKQTTEWSTAIIPALKNWGLVGQAGTTDFLPLDNVLFDDTATTTTVDISGGDITPNAVRFNNSAKTFVVNGPGAITGAANIVKDGIEEVTISSAHSFTGPVTLNAGILSVPTIDNSGVNSPLGAGNTVAFNGGTLNVAGGSTDRAFTLDVGNGTIKTDGTFTYAGLISGAGNLSKTGFGTAVFTGVRTGFNSGLVLKEGTVQFSTVDALGGPTQTVTLDGGALEYTGAAALDWGVAAQTRTINSLSGGTIRVTQGVPGNGLSLGRAGSLTGAGAITKDGVGPLRISGDNVGLTGNWTIAAGAIDALSVNALGSGHVTVNGDLNGIATLVTRGQAAPNTFTLPNNITLNGGRLQVRSGDTGTFGGTVDVVANSFVRLSSFTSAGTLNMTISGPLTGNMSLTIEGIAAGTKALILTNPANTFSGQFIVNAAQGLTAQPPVTGNPFGTASIALTDARLRLLDDGTSSNGIIAYGNNVTIAGTLVSSIDVDRSGATATTTGNTIRLGSLALTAPTIDITGANGYGVEFTGPNDLGPNPTINASTGNITLSGATTAAGPLTKSGAGLLEFDGLGTVTIAGNVAVQGGILAVNNTLADTSNVDVISGTLSGSGTVAGNVNVIAATGIIAPGNSAGILSVGGNVSFFAGSAFNVELTHLSAGVPVAGTDYDQLSVGTGPLDGTVDITGANLNITTGTGFIPNDLFFIIVNDGVDAVTGTFANVPAAGTPFIVNGVQFEISYDANFATSALHGGNDVALIVPEPGSAVLLLGSLVVLAARRRRTA